MRIFTIFASSPNTFGVIKSKAMSRMGHVARMVEMTNVYTVWSKKLKGKPTLET